MIELLYKAPFKYTEFRTQGTKFVDKGYFFSTLYVIEKDNNLYLLYSGQFKKKEKMYGVIRDWRQHTFTEVINTTDGNRLLWDALIHFYHSIGKLGYTNKITKEWNI